LINLKQTKNKFKLKEIVCFIILILLILDEITTFIGLKMFNVYELNPIRRYSFIINAIIKFGSLVVIYYISKSKIEERFEKIKTIAIISLLLYYLIVVINNIKIIKG